MANFKITLTHEHEEQIVSHCVKNNIDFKQSNAYDETIAAFKENPAIYVKTNSDGVEEKHNVTSRVARLVECDIRVIYRIADKVLLAAEKHKKDIWDENIKKSKSGYVPNLDKLVENLYRLNIVNENSYLGLVCFLMQLRYTRNNEMTENDKTCVFFNGVARNGKSATAKAICDVETNYGNVYCPGSGTILESVHEEMVWQSHLNYFDEVKPSDITRERLLLIINGGDRPVNPKNKRQYIQHVNTNNIFTSNGQIYLKQRRVSVIKFGDRLNGRPLEAGSLKKIISDIFEALPNFDRYYDIYGIVSKANESRINPLAVSSIITYMNKKLHYVKDGDDKGLNNAITFSPHDVNNCVKNVYSKQILQSERTEGVKQALEDFVQRGLMEEIVYEKNTTRHFKVTGENYLKIMAEFDSMNTSYEENTKISKDELRALLLPYFIETSPDDEPQTTTMPPAKFVECEHVDEKDLKEDPYLIPEENLQQGRILWNSIAKQIQDIFEPEPNPLSYDYEPKIPFNEKPEILYDLMTPEACEYLGLYAFIELFKTYYSKDVITKAYLDQTGLENDEALMSADKEKYSLAYDNFEENMLYFQKKRCGEMPEEPRDPNYKKRLLPI